MGESGCPCKGLKSGLVHAVGLFIVVFLAVTLAICAANRCAWCQGKLIQSPAPQAQIK